MSEQLPKLNNPDECIEILESGSKAAPQSPSGAKKLFMFGLGCFVVALLVGFIGFAMGLGAGLSGMAGGPSRGAGGESAVASVFIVIGFIAFIGTVVAWFGALVAGVSSKFNL